MGNSTLDLVKIVLVFSYLITTTGDSIESPQVIKQLGLQVIVLKIKLGLTQGLSLLIQSPLFWAFLSV